MELYKKIKIWVIDIDGTMTDSGIYYDENGNEIKKFSTKDAAGFFAAHAMKMKVMVLTGRECLATTKRMKELKVDFLYQNISNKVEFLKNFMKKHRLTREMLAYIGDDLNDLPAMSLCGFVGCPADSCLEIKERADYISPIKGGYGAVRDVIEYVFRQDNVWEKAVQNIYGIGK